MNTPIGTFIAHRREKDGVVQNLFDHLQEVSRLTGEFASKVGLGKHGELIGLLHDLGKASSEFNNYIRSATGLINKGEDGYVDVNKKKGKIDHSSAGAQAIYRHLNKSNKEMVFISQILPLIVSSHHSGLQDCLSPDGDDKFSDRMSKPDELTRLTESFSNLDERTKRKFDDLLSDPSALGHSLNLVICSMSENNDASETLMLKAGLLIRFLFSCLVDADRLDTADFALPEQALKRNYGKYVPWEKLLEKLEQHLCKFKITNEIDILRRKIADDCLRFSKERKGLYQLTVPTGGGKTLSSLRFALHHANEHKLDRIFYIIPYTSIIDQNAKVAREALEDKGETGVYLNNVVLEHHSNLMVEEENEEENEKQKILSENWDAPIVFTTMVQFLETMFGAGTRNARRMHQLANSVIIFDEIQTLPIKCIHLFNLAIRFLTNTCGSTVVLCTATQPLLDKVQPESRALIIQTKQEIMSDVQKLFKDLKRVNVLDVRQTGGWNEQEVAELAEQEIAVTGSVLIIVNTKTAACNLFKQLQNYSLAKVYHLSTNMCPAHRMKILDEIKKRLDKEPIICVSTQLIEAGVDVDFGTVIRSTAGLDSIAQAAGRCNRNGKRQAGRVFVLNPKFENLDRLKDIKKGREVTERILEDYKTNAEQFDEDILGPKAMERFYHYYFFQQKDDMCYRVGGNTFSRDDSLFELLSQNRLSVMEFQRKNQQSSPLIPIRQSFKSAAKAFKPIDSVTQGIIVPFESEGERIIHELCATTTMEQQYKLLKEAQRYSVNVFQYQMDELQRNKGILQTDSGVFYLNDQFYSDKFGLSTSPVNLMKFLNV